MSKQEILDAIQAYRSENGAPLSKLGYFCAPFRPAAGPLRDRVIKLYCAVDDQAQLARLQKAHDAYYQILIENGVLVPETCFSILEIDGRRHPVIDQDALPSAQMMRTRMLEDDIAQCLAHLQSAAECIAQFWISQENKLGRVGFHPSIRNFAITPKGAVFFDTFPPLIDYSRDEMGRLLLVFSEKRLMRWVGPLIQSRVTAIQDEWYSPSETYLGLIGSACRLRPEYTAEIMQWARDWAQQHMAPWSEPIRNGLAQPPRLPGYWTKFRTILGLEGAPNLTKPDDA